MGYGFHNTPCFSSLHMSTLQGIKTHAAGLNAGESYVLFAAMLTARPWDAIVQQRSDKLYIPRSKEDKQRIQVCMGGHSDGQQWGANCVAIRALQRSLRKRLPSCCCGCLARCCCC